MNKRLSILGIFCLIVFSLQAAKVDTLMIRSSAMNRNIQTVVIVPDKACKKKGSACPTLYLLHGIKDNAKTWISKKNNLPTIADEKNIFIVCPNAEKSFFWDSPIKSDSQFETFISSELVSYIDQHYRTLPYPTQRAITGLSMGGHGAMYLAMRHKTVWGAAGSMSGSLDLLPLQTIGGTYINTAIEELIGTPTENPRNYERYSAISQIDLIKNNDLALIIDCGKDDFLYFINCDFHKRLNQMGINHDFIIRPGSHNWEYWINAVDYQILFFCHFFNRTTR